MSAAGYDCYDGPCPTGRATSSCPTCGTRPAFSVDGWRDEEDVTCLICLSRAS